MIDDKTSRNERLSRLFRLHGAIVLAREIKESAPILSLVRHEVTAYRLLPGHFVEIEYQEQGTDCSTILLNSGCNCPCMNLATFFVHSSDVSNIRQILMKRNRGDWFSVAYQKLEENDDCFLNVHVQARDFFVLQEIREAIIDGIMSYFTTEFWFHDRIPFLLQELTCRLFENYGR